MSLNNKLKRLNRIMVEQARKAGREIDQKSITLIINPALNEEMHFDSKRALLGGSMRKRRRTRNTLTNIRNTTIVVFQQVPMPVPIGNPTMPAVSLGPDIELAAPVNTSPNIELSEKEIIQITNQWNMSEVEMTKAEEQLVECLKKTTMLEFDSVDKLPEVGDGEALYFIGDKEAIYRWRNDGYEMLGLSETLSLATKSPVVAEAVKELPVLGWARKLWGTLTGKLAGTTTA